MMNKILTALLPIAFIFSCNTEKPSTHPAYRQYLKDIKSSTYKIYDQEKGQFYFVDRYGNQKFDATKYSKVGLQYYKGNIDVWLDGKQAILDEEGNYVVPFKYEKLKFYQDGKFFAFKDTSWIYTNNSGKEFFNLSSNMSPNSYFGKNGLAAVEVNDYWKGFINRDGKLVIDPDFMRVIEFGGYDITAVQNSETKWGFINSKGEYVISPEFDSFMGSTTRRFEDDVELVHHNERGYSLVNRVSGKIIFDSIYERLPCEEYSNLIPILKLDNTAGFIDRNGNIVIPFNYQDVDCFDSRGIAPAKINGYWGWLNINGEYVIEPTFVYVWEFRDDDFTVVSRNLLTVGMINREGEMVVQDTFLQFGLKNHLIKKNWELLLAESKQGYGYIDRSGKYVIEPRFGHSRDFDNRDYACARDSSFYFGVIDRSGNYLIKPIFDYLEFEMDSDILKYRLGDKSGYFSLDQKHFYGLSKKSLDKLHEKLLEKRGIDWKPKY